ncbi:endolytic transglycosylase MltG [Marinobacter sp.]|uniref:endolytic transglycosylase MltG n=1 Tax=Marinobacter sp. TaxID=50741 RepID=UPI002B26E9A6|nr:endolytic transglycosylase MltG [Marinobacter sp.]
MFRKLIVSVFALGIIAAAAIGLWVWQGLDTLKKPVALEEPVLFSVEHGTSFNGLAHKFAQQGLVQDSLWLRLYGRLKPEHTRIKAGDYELTPGMTPLDIVESMVEGKVKLWAVQFIEGWTFADLRSALAKSENLEKVTTDWSDEQIMESVGAGDQHPEGWFFPDTYMFSGSETDLDILKRAYSRMASLLEQEWAERAKDLPYETPYQALIMASIVERETGAPYERQQVAGVFVRRLVKGMRLQTDPTVIYGMGDNYDGRIRKRDLRTHTPYNTYRIDGLPPTPIALPGRDSIHAALHPDDGDTLYFVARGDGSHKFSRTLAEHQRAVRAFQLNRKEGYRSYPVPGANANNGGDD